MSKMNQNLPGCRVPDSGWPLALHQPVKDLLYLEGGGSRRDGSYCPHGFGTDAG